MPSELLKYPEPPDLLKKRSGLSLLKWFGPGVIMASVSIGSGETLLASRGGAIFGYSVIWCLLAGMVLKGVQIYTSARYMALSGEHPMESWRYLPGPRAWFPWFLLVITVMCLPFLLASLSMLIGTFVNWIGGVDLQKPAAEVYSRLWATILIGTAALMSLRQGYGFLEISQKVIVAVLLGCILVAAVACQPAIGGLIAGMVPSVPVHPDWVKESYPDIAGRPAWLEVITYVGLIGAGLPAYVGYLGFLRDKGWSFFQVERISHHREKETFRAIDMSSENVNRGRKWLLPVRIDVGLSFLCVTIFSIAFMVLGADLLHPRQLVPDKMNLVNYQAEFLTQLHPSLLYVYQVGIFAAIGGTVFATFDVWTKTTYESLLPIVRAPEMLEYQKVKRVVMIYCIVVGLIVMWGGLFWKPLSNPVSLVQVPALIGGAFGCGLWCLGVWWVDRKNLPVGLRLSWWQQILLILSGVILAVMGLVGSWLKLFGG
ncbi:MAG: Nramp family divalent metal transporter [Limisphaerales bacterium]